MNVRQYLWPLLGLFALTSCATTYKDFNPAKVKPQEGVVIGRVKIRYNGLDLNPSCGICFNSVNGSCQKLTEEGFVIQRLKAGPASLRRIVCKDTSLQHYNLQDAVFDVKAQAVTYFGDVVIDWTNSGGVKSTDLFGVIGVLISESKNDGTIKMSVSPSAESEVSQAYSNVAHQPTVNLRKRIAQVGK